MILTNWANGMFWAKMKVIATGYSGSNLKTLMCFWLQVGIKWYWFGI